MPKVSSTADPSAAVCLHNACAWPLWGVCCAVEVCAALKPGIHQTRPGVNSGFDPVTVLGDVACGYWVVLHRGEGVVLLTIYYGQALHFGAAALYAAQQYYCSSSLCVLLCQRPEFHMAAAGMRAADVAVSVAHLAVSLLHALQVVSSAVLHLQPQVLYVGVSLLMLVGIVFVACSHVCVSGWSSCAPLCLAGTETLHKVLAKHDPQGA